MTKRERSSRPDRPSTERSLDALLAMGPPQSGPLDHAALDRDALADDDPARWQAVAQVLTALTSAPESSELAGEARALAEFRALARFQDQARFQAQFQTGAHGAGRPSRAPRRGPGWVTWLRGGRPAVAVATGAVLMGGLLAVAYAGDLPAAAQRLAHDTINAPAVGRSESPAPDPAASSPPAGSPGPARHRSTPVPAVPDRRVHGGSPSSHLHQNRSASSRPGSPAGRRGRQGQPGRPGRSAEPGPTQVPSPSASISSPAGVTPSPSAAPSPTQSGHHPEASPSSSQNAPP